MATLGVNANINYDVVEGWKFVDGKLKEIAGQISQLAHATPNREAFVRSTVEKVYHELSARYNVMVFNMRQEYDFSTPPTADAKFQQVDYDGIPFGIWAFKDGTFINKGDGGWINWGFKGWYNCNEKHVDFHAPPVA